MRRDARRASLTVSPGRARGIWLELLQPGRRLPPCELQAGQRPDDQHSGVMGERIIMLRDGRSAWQGSAAALLEGGDPELAELAKTWDWWRG